MKASPLYDYSDWLQNNMGNEETEARFLVTEAKLFCPPAALHLLKILFRRTTTALRPPDLKSFVTGEFQIKAKTIPELVQCMTDNGLQFAPAMRGDEAAYTMLRERLAAYDRSVRATPRQTPTRRISVRKRRHEERVSPLLPSQEENTPAELKVFNRRAFWTGAFQGP
jgi:hypothetical protein